MWQWIIANTLISLAVVAIALAFTRRWRSRPASSHILWLLALVLLVMPPWPGSLLPESGGWGSWATGLEDLLVRSPSPSSEPAPLEQAIYEGGMPRDEPGEEPPPVPIGFAPARDEETAAESGPEPESTESRHEAPEPKSVSASVVIRPRTDATPVWRPEAGLLPAGWVGALGRIWALGSIVLGLVFLAGTLRLGWRLRRSLPAPRPLLDCVRRTAHRLGIQPPRVRLAPGLGAPFVWSGGRPVLVWPATPDGEPAVPLDAGIVTHELAHLRRRDHWVAWIELIATSLLWWHPLLWVIRARLRHFSEVAADAWVVWAYPEGRRDYAESLIGAASELPRSTRLLPALGALDSSARSFRSRLEVIMRGEARARAVSPIVLLIAAATLLVAVPIRSVRGGAHGERRTVLLPADVEAAARRQTDQRLIDFHVVKQEWQMALPLLELACADDPTNGRNHHLLGYASIVNGEREQALTAFEHQLELGYRPATAHYNIACSLSLLGRPDEAFLHLERSLAGGFLQAELMAQDPDLDALRVSPRFQDLLDGARRTLAHHQAAQARLTGGSPTLADVEAALPDLKAAESAMPEAFDRFRQHGFWLLNAGAFDLAAQRFERCLDEAAGFDEVARYGLACARAEQRQSTVAWKELARSRWLGLDLEALQDGVDPVWHELAQDPELQGARVLAPGALAQWTAAEAALRQHDWRAARHHLSELVAIHPGSAPAWEQLGVAALHAGALEAARAAHRRQIASGHAISRGLVQLARIAAREGDADRAFALLHRMLDLGSQPPDLPAADPHLDELRDDPRWEAYRTRSRKLTEVTTPQ